MSTNKSNKPELRFKGFSDDWEQRKFGEIAATRRGLTYKPGDIVDGGKRVLRSSNINEDTFEICEDDVFVNEGAVNIPYVKNGDILITSANGSSRLVGKHAIVRDIPENCVVHGGFMLLASSDEPEFVNALMSSQWYTRFINVFVAGGNGAIGNLNKNDLDEQIVLVPSTKERKKIGTYFSNLDNLITLHQRKCDNLKIIKKSMLNNLFPKIGEKVPKWRFKGFNNDWEQRKLSDLVDVYSGMDYKHLSIGNIPVFGTGGYMLSVDRALSYDRNAIGIGRKGTIDKPYILKAPFWTVDTLFYCIPRDEGTLNFDYDLFQCIDWKQKDESTGVPSLSKVAINDTDVMVPKTDEQKKIGYFFEELDLVITLHQRKCDDLQKLKKALLQQMFC